MQTLHCRKMLEWSGMTCLWWSHVGCLKSLPCLHVFSQDLFHALSEYWGKADLSVVSRVLLYPFFINGCNSHSLQSGDLVLLPWLFKYNEECLDNYTGQFPQNSGIHLIGSYWLVSSQVVSNLVLFHSNTLQPLFPWSIWVCPIPDAESITCPCWTSCSWWLFISLICWGTSAGTLCPQGTWQHLSVYLLENLFITPWILCSSC